MSNAIKRLIGSSPAVEVLLWFAPLGTAIRLLVLSISVSAARSVNWREFREHCHWMGQRSFHFVALSAVFIAIALTVECILELKRYQAEDLTGAAIAIGLLRELGPLTISVAWCARVSALVSEEARNQKDRWTSDSSFASEFVFPRLLAAVSMAIPLGAYGLLVGFITAGLFAPLFGVSSLNYFVDSAREAIQDRDIIVYFTKLIAVNPIVGVLVGAVCGLHARSKDEPVAANAVTGTFLGCLALNLAVTVAAYLRGGAIL